MLINIVGGSKSQKKHVYKMVEFCAKMLMPRMSNLDITVNLCKPTGAIGYCLETDNNRTFEIEVDKTQSLRRLLETLAHEMVHVKQYELGELAQGSETHIDYWDRPSEIEAHGREVGLFVRWAEKERLAHLKWTQTQKGQTT